MSTVVQDDPRLRRAPQPVSLDRIAADGKFLRVGDERYLVKGVTYGTFAPDDHGHQFPSPSQVAEDFRLMAELGINTVRTYTAPRRDLLDEAARNGLRVMVGLPWSQERAARLALAAADRLAGIEGVELLTPRGNMATLVTFRIAGWPAEMLERTLRSFQQGTRTNPVMVSVAKSLDDEQVRALALYWSTVPRVLPKAPAKAKK